MRLLSKFLTSATNPSQFPAPMAPEIAFLGRSNVGKSSLINTLLGEKMAKTSSTPGRTRMINFFGVRRPGQPRTEWVFADLPGYGYAKVSREVSAEWPSFIEPYLEHRPNLALCIVLVDTNIPPQDKDRQMIEWLQHVGRPFLVVGTKSDRVSANQLHKQLNLLLQEHRIPQVLPFSTKTGKGKEELWAAIRKAGDALNSAESSEASSA